MDIKTLTNDADLQRSIARLKAQERHYSDVVDDAGYQYVDLVMEGGGMLGIALVGYTWAMEQLGLRFLGIGGTSAGAINALLLAAVAPPGECKSDILLDELVNLDFKRFIDGDDDARDLIDTWIEAGEHIDFREKIKLGFKAMQVIDSLTGQLGLNPGVAFESWLRDLLRRRGIENYAALRERMHTLPAGLRAGDKPLTVHTAGSQLAVVAADVSTETKAVFPRDADLYFPDVDRINPAIFARASMSIPFFFMPYRVGPLRRNPDIERLWKERTGFDAATEGGLPEHALFIDGGIMSNFPIDLFHDYTQVPSAPTFGVKLQYDQRRRRIDGPMSLLSAIFNSARHCLDYDFISRNRDYQHLVQWIPCERYNWLDFEMSEPDKIGLFREGALKAIEFLEKFDWPAYRVLREEMLHPEDV